VAGAVGASLLSLTVLVWACSVVGVSVVQGSSMAPSLVPGDLLVFERVARSVSPGDVVVIPRPGWPAGVAHRVVRGSAAGVLQTKGDANPVPDRDPVMQAALLGRVVARVPSGALARAVAVRLRRWYTRVPNTQTGDDGDMSGAATPRPGIGVRD
jgi:signal peptidase I